MTTYTATYSPEDNKLRLYASQRLDDETYQRIKAAGFQWAPKQDLFYAPIWTPKREDLLIELAGEIDDEDTSLVDRAEERADRFDGYQANRKRDAETAAEGVKRIADGIPFGQPILVGHHSERHARKDKERIENGMRKAVKMWETASYWQARAAGAISHAKYKERPEVRARRIKTIEADRRKVERSKKENATKRALWLSVTSHAQADTFANYCHFNCTDEGRAHGGMWSAWDVLRPDGDRYQHCPSWTWEQVQARALEVYRAETPMTDRWLAHYDNRLAYERAMLDEQGATHLLDKKPRKQLPPIMNYRATAGSIQTENRYNRGSVMVCRQVDMTAAEYAKIYTDYKGCHLSLDKSHRFRVAIIKNHERVAVYITDSKDHGEPKAQAPTEHPAARIPDPPPPPLVTERREPKPVDPQASLFDAMRQTLKNGGVQVVAVPQLFPTPRDLAERMVDTAGIEPGHRVLEPSAGTGVLLKAICDRIDVRTLQPWAAVEINAGLAKALPQGGVTWSCDFLALTGEELGTFDRIIMNPPFQNGSDIEHIEHARKFLRPGGRLVAICANGSRQRAKLMTVVEESGGTWEDLPPDTFKSAGTGVNTALLVIEG